MKIKRFKKAVLVLLAMAFVMLTGCPNPTVVDPKPSDPKLSLAQQVVNELGDALSSIGRAAVSPDIPAIKVAALKKITDDGYANSEELDKILPSMISGVAEGAKGLGAETKASIYATSAKSALESLGTPERSKKLSSITLAQTVGSVSEATVAVVVKSLPAESVSASLAAVSKATVSVVCTNVSYTSVSDAAVSATVTGSLKGLEKGLTNTTDTTVMMASFGAILEASLAEAAVTKKESMGDLLTAVNSDVAKASQEKVGGKEKSYAASLSSTTIKASVKIAVSVAGNDNEAAQKAKDLIIAAVVGQKNGGVTVSSSVVTDAIADNSENTSNLGENFATDIEDSIEIINAETVPTVTVTASPKVLKVAGEVTLTATIEAVGERTVSWTQTAGPTVSITDLNQADATVNIQIPGVYAFEVTVKNKSGYLSASSSVTVVFEKASANVTNLLDAGIAALEKKDFDLALTKFESAYSADKTNSEVTFWYAFMSMMSISTDPDTVSLMQNRIGFKSYPASINELFSNKWFNGKYYNTTQGRILDQTKPVMLPALTVPKWAESIYSQMDIQGESAEFTSVNSYYIILMMNLIANNPNGLNTMLDQVLSGVYGTRFDRVVQLIDSLPNTASITLPQSLIDAYNPFYKADSDAEPMPPISIRKAELKALSSSLQMNKSFLQNLASYNLDYSLTFLQNAMWTTEGGNKTLEDLFKQNNPIKAGFLGNRNQGTRDASKATFLAAIDDLTDSLSLFEADIVDFSTLAYQASAMLDPDAVSMILESLGDASALLTTLRSSITGSGSLFINPAAMNGGSITDLLSKTPVEGAMECKPSALWSTDIFNPARLFEVTGTKSNPTGIKLYGLIEENDGKVWKEVVRPTEGTPSPEYIGSGVKINLDRVRELVNVPDSVFEYGIGFIPLAIHYEGLLKISSDDWKLIDWLSK